MGVFELNRDNQIVWANSSMTEILAVDSPESLHGRSVSEFYIEQTEFEQVCREVSENGEVRNKSVQLKGRDGEVLFAKMNSVAIFETVGFTQI